MEKKIYEAGIELKGDDQPGEFQAIFSTFNVIDKDGDVTVPGAFTDGQKVRIAYWGHRWQDLPVGKGVIHADDMKAWVDGKFFLDTDAGMETYKTVKNLEDLQEWSYGFDVIEAERGNYDGEPVKLLKKLMVHEISPVLLGAGVGTMTTAIKSADETPKDESELPEEQTDDQTGDGASSGDELLDNEIQDEVEDEAGDGKSSDFAMEHKKLKLRIYRLEHNDD